MEKKIITQEMREQLRSPFPPKAYSKHPTKTFLTTLKAMYVTERLNDVFGVGRWTIETEIIERTDNYVLVQGEFKALDLDVILPKQYGGHNTTGTNIEIADGYKSALTDCQSKIASYLEIGIEMFKGNINMNKPKANFEIRELTKSEVEERWNGKIYKGTLVYINDTQIQPPVSQLNKLLLHTKYIKE